VTRRGFVVLVLAIAGCAQLPAPPGRTGPLLDPALPPASLGRELARSAVVTGEYRDRTYSMRVEVEVTPERLVVVGMSHMGVPLFTLEQTSAGVRVQSNARGGPPLDPAHLLSDLQLVHWPAHALEDALASRGLRLLDRPSEGVRRVVDRDGGLLVEIVHLRSGDDPAVTTVRHLDPPYGLRIETVAEHALR
jgi:hypothetical protein